MARIRQDTPTARLSADMTTTTPKARLRWYQYSLRSLFVLTVLVAIAGSWFAVKKQQVERQRAAVRAIKELGGMVRYDYELHVDFTPTGAAPPGPSRLRALLGDDFFAHVIVARLKGAAVTDSKLECLKDFPRLRWLCLDHAEITDAGLKQVEGLTRLEWLLVVETKATDEGVERLKRALPDCEIVEGLPLDF